MKTIALAEIIKEKDLDIDMLSKQLFPSVKYPRHALTRVMRGEGQLDAEQISKLSAITNIPIEELFTVEGWKTKGSKEGIFEFTLGEYSAIVDLPNSKTVIMHSGSSFHEEIIHDKSISLSKYLKHLTQVINKNSKK